METKQIVLPATWKLASEANKGNRRDQAVLWKVRICRVMTQAPVVTESSVGSGTALDLKDDQHLDLGRQ